MPSRVRATRPYVGYARKRPHRSFDVVLLITIRNRRPAGGGSPSAGPGKTKMLRRPSGCGPGPADPEALPSDLQPWSCAGSERGPANPSSLSRSAGPAAKPSISSILSDVITSSMAVTQTARSNSKVTWAASGSGTKLFTYVPSRIAMSPRPRVKNLFTRRPTPADVSSSLPGPAAMYEMPSFLTAQSPRIDPGGTDTATSSACVRILSRTVGGLFPRQPPAVPFELLPDAPLAELLDSAGQPPLPKEPPPEPGNSHASSPDELFSGGRATGPNTGPSGGPDLPKTKRYGAEMVAGAGLSPWNSRGASGSSSGLISPRLPPWCSETELK
mmetsp:Transcript_68555/g.182903  ORF Transcript_68555/g.182903 Transcript_68555/m.182903 type:complete len:329 (-) Transcript_68555:2118-3104(-)